MNNRDELTAPGPFELSGGALCLDFANTWGNRADRGKDRLRGYHDLLAFARQTGCLTKARAAALSLSAAGDADAADAALAHGRELRDVVFRVFSSRAARRDVSPQDIDRLNALLAEALSHRRLERRDGGFVWSWSDWDAGDLRAPIWPIVDSAAALLTSGDFDRVRECGAEDCNWLFLDRSRAGTRRWCSMSSCGNRAKARRHYRRRQNS